jgi:hypothetical protein
MFRRILLRILRALLGSKQPAPGPTVVSSAAGSLTAPTPTKAEIEVGTYSRSLSAILLGSKHDPGPTFVSSAKAEIDAEKLERYRALIERGEPLPVIRTLSSGDPCFFDEIATMPRKRGDDDDWGRVQITDKGLFFEGDRNVTCQWSKVLTIQINYSAIVIHMTNKSSPLEIGVSPEARAQRGHLIALTTWKRTQTTTAAPALPQRRRPPKASTRLADLPIGDDTHLNLGSGLGYSIAVVGESRRQSALRTLSNGWRERGDNVSFIVELIPEPDNPYDAHAVKVVIQGGEQAGYLSREDADDYRTVMKALSETGKKGLCRAKLIGGTDDKPTFGVIIDLEAPEKLLVLITPGGQPF